MAIQKVTMMRYNGTDWDSIYLANSADVTFLASQITVAGAAGYTDAETIAAGTPMETIVGRLIGSLALLENTTVPGLAAGTGITSLDASKLTGVVSRKNLPTDVGGKVVTVNTELEKDALTSTQVNIGDIVKVTENSKAYVVSAIVTDPSESITFVDLSATITVDDLPDAAMFHMETVADSTARLALTTTQVQNGDVVEQTDTGALYFVVDDTQLNAEAGYKQITVTSIAWDAVTGKPTTVADSGLTDALADGDVSVTYEADHVVGWSQGTNDTTTTQYDINGKANTACVADLASNANQLGGQNPTYYATAADVTTIQAQIGVTPNPDASPDPVAGSGILKDIYDLKSGKAITSLAASKIVGQLSIDNIPPAAVERLHVVENADALATLTSETVQNGDTIKVNDSGLMYFVTDDTKLGGADYMNGLSVYTAGSASSVPWTGVTGTPTTLAGYGITDAVAANEKVTEANASNAGRILVLNAQGNLDVNITGSAGSVAWENITNAPTSTVTAIDNAVTAATHTNRTVLDALGDDTGTLTYNGNAVAMKSELDALAVSAIPIVNDVTVDLADAANGQLAMEIIV